MHIYDTSVLILPPIIIDLLLFLREKKCVWITDFFIFSSETMVRDKSQVKIILDTFDAKYFLDPN